MYPEYEIIEKAEIYYNTLKASASTATLSVNQQVIMSLCDMMIEIWRDWQADTRHYQPSKAKHTAYLEKVEAERIKLDQSDVEYDTAKQVIKDCQQYIKLLVLPRVQNRAKPRVF